MSQMNVEKPEEDPKLAGDRLNVLLLVYMYMLQCIPRSITDGIAITLQKRHISYSDQAGFSLISYSYCFKLLWSPIIDCLYSKRLGRRKTWVIPTQYLIGIFLLVISLKLDDWMGSEDGTRRPKTGLLGIMFFSCVCLSSTQDVAVDGWSLTMLKRRNVGHAGTCNNLGYALSQFVGYVLFILLESKDFCNKFRSVPQDHGFVTFSSYTLFWSIVFIVSSTVILIFKTEKSSDSTYDSDESRLSLSDSYKCMWQILKLRPVQEFCLILLTFQVGPAPSNGVARFKLIDAGVPNSSFAMMMASAIPLEIIVPFTLSRFLVGKSAMRYFILTYLSRMALSVTYAMLIFVAPYVKDENKVLPNWYHWALLPLFSIDVFSEYIMYTTLYAFFSRISDPRFGGMYISLLNAVAAIGYRWPVALALWLVDSLTIRSCTEVHGREECAVLLDGFFFEVIFCVIFGILWILAMKKRTFKLEDMDRSAWLIKENKKDNLLQSAASNG